MCPRAYRSPLREAHQVEIRQRIAAAAAALHAEKGALGTSFKEIAQRADVALPTVYKHFPTLDALVPACTQHAISKAPPFGPDQLDAGADLSGRLRLLIRGAFAQHRYFQPWFRWGESEHIPALKPIQQHGQDHLRGLIERAMAPVFPGQVPASLLATAEALLGFGAWQVLVHRLSPRRAQVAAHLALFTLIRAHPGARPEVPHVHPH